MRLRTYIACLALVAAFAAGSACSSSGGAPTATTTQAVAPSPETYAARGPFGVGVTTIEVVDTSRPTVPNRDAPGSPERRMAVEIWYPAATDVQSPEARDVPVERSGSPYPLIIFAHGYTAFRRQSATFTQGLASHGYIVASPDFPQSRIDTPGGPRLWAALDQPKDVSFVINEMLRRNGDSASPLAGTMDEARIGMAGHSLGGLTTLLTAYGADRDPRLKAILPISPVGCLFPASVTSDRTLPVMVVGGSDEVIVDPGWIKMAYDAVPPPKYRVEIIGADHVRFADVNIPDSQIANVVGNLEGSDFIADALKTAAGDGANASTCLQRTMVSDEPISGDRQRELLRTVGVPFFDAYLRDDAGAMRFLRETLPGLDGVRVEADAGG